MEKPVISGRPGFSLCGKWRFLMSVSLECQLKSRLPFWDKLTVREREFLLDKSRVVGFTAGEHVHGGDTECLGVLLILSGLLRTYLLSEDGKEATIYRIKQDEILPALRLLHTGSRFF